MKIKSLILQSYKVTLLETINDLKNAFFYTNKQGTLQVRRYGHYYIIVTAEKVIKFTSQTNSK